MALRCLIVDDNAGFLAAASDVLAREGIVVAGLASTSAEAVALVGDLRPDVVLVDIDLGDENGFDLAGRLATDGGPAVILISTYTEADVGELVTASAAVGFLSKSQITGRGIRALLANGR